MVTSDYLQDQLKGLDFSLSGWGRSEAHELLHILHEGEEICELVNGYYAGGFAMLVATDSRLILIDKKPLGFLTVEDVRYDMIAEIDLNHRLLIAHINVATGNNKMMRFSSWNQQRLRRTINRVQQLVASARKSQDKHAEGQKEHLAQINQQLQSYLLAQHQQQQDLRAQLEAVKEGEKAPEEVKVEHIKPSHELSDYLFAQSLLAQAKQEHPELPLPEPNQLATEVINAAHMAPDIPYSPETATQIDELYEEGVKEVFGKHAAMAAAEQAGRNNTMSEQELNKRAKKYGRMGLVPEGLGVHPFRVAYKMTARALKGRKQAVTTY